MEALNAGILQCSWNSIKKDWVQVANRTSHLLLPNLSLLGYHNSLSILNDSCLLKGYTIQTLNHRVRVDTNSRVHRYSGMCTNILNAVTLSAQFITNRGHWTKSYTRLTSILRGCKWPIMNTIFVNLSNVSRWQLFSRKLERFHKDSNSESTVKFLQRIRDNEWRIEAHPQQKTLWLLLFATFFAIHSSYRY